MNSTKINLGGAKMKKINRILGVVVILLTFSLNSCALLYLEYQKNKEMKKINEKFEEMEKIDEKRYEERLHGKITREEMKKINEKRYEEILHGKITRNEISP